MKHLSATITEKINEKLEKICEKTGLTKSDLVRRALEKYFKEYNKEK